MFLWCMNIFVTDFCPKKSAHALDDKRVVKMVLESAQLLSTAIYINSNTIYKELYKPTHMKHPCTIWASETNQNWNWLLDHLNALCHEYTYRYEKTHKTEGIIKSLMEHSCHIKPGSLTQFPNCTKSEAMKIDFKDVKDVHLAYKKYLAAKWAVDKRPPKWTKRGIPEWYETKQF